jgi:hypothetical protein
MSLFRPSVVGLACIACGLAGRFVFRTYCPPATRVGEIDKAVVLAPFFGLGWLLLCVPVVKKMYGPTELDLREALTWLMMTIGALVCLWLVFSA